MIERKVKFDQDAAFKAIVGVDRQSALKPRATEMSEAVRVKNKGRVQRSYFLDRDIDKALRRMELEEEANLTETVNKVLREGLKEYL